jgi:hypothetical protein
MIPRGHTRPYQASPDADSLIEEGEALARLRGRAVQHEVGQQRPQARRDGGRRPVASAQEEVAEQAQVQRRRGWRRGCARLHRGATIARAVPGGRPNGAIYRCSAQRGEYSSRPGARHPPAWALPGQLKDDKD